MKGFIRKVLVYILCGCLMLCPDITDTVSASEIIPSALSNSTPDGYDDGFLAAYEELSEFIAYHELPASISLETFKENYDVSKYSSYDEYLQAWYSVFDVTDYDSSTAYTLSRSNWYYNTGTRLTAVPNYSKYNLLSIVRKGDIIFEANGSSGIYGHACIVEGIYYDAFYGRYYIRMIESIGYTSTGGQADGVSRGVLDDERFDNRAGAVLRVNSASEDVINGAVSFCVSQIGKSYFYDGKKDTESTQEDWYCSELIWAAYKNQGIDIENDTNSLGILPVEINSSTMVTNVAVSTIGTPQNVQVSMSNSTTAQITWSSVSGASEYDVYYSDSYNGTYLYLGTSSTTSMTMGIASGAIRYFRVQALKGNVTGNLSDPKGVRNEFVAPSILNIYTPSSTSISLTWYAVQGATSYRVYRSTDGSSTYTQIATTNSPTYTDTGLTSGIKYNYRVAAVNGT